MKKEGYLIASFDSEGKKEEPLMFRAIRRSKRHQLEWAIAVEDLMMKKSILPAREELGENQGGSSFWWNTENPGAIDKKVPESKNIVRILKASGLSVESLDLKKLDDELCEKLKNLQTKNEWS